MLIRVTSLPCPRFAPAFLTGMRRAVPPSATNAAGVPAAGRRLLDGSAVLSRLNPSACGGLSCITVPRCLSSKISVLPGMARKLSGSIGVLALAHVFSAKRS